MPIRAQRKRSKGWRMPENTVSVTRPGRFGNPFTIGAYYSSGYSGTLEVATQHCVEAFRAWLTGADHWWKHPTAPPDVIVLRGRDLACWCKVDAKWCHADVLLEVANALEGDTP